MKKNREVLLILSTILIFLFINNFFYNFYYTLNSNYTERMTHHYGYCDKQGYGFINDMRIKHKLDKKNIKIVNYKIHPSSEFFFYDTNKYFYSDFLILLNYNNFNNIENSKINISMNNTNVEYKILENYENCFLLIK